MSFNPFDIAEHKYKGSSNIQESSSAFDIAERQMNEVPSFEEDVNLQRDIERNQSQFTSRMLEGLVGLPTDLINFAGGLFGYDPGLPGSEEARKFSEEITQDYTSPQNELEEKVGETMKDIALFALPGSKHYGIARNIGIPIAANLAKEGFKYSGADEKMGAYGKLGTMVILDLFSGRKNLGSAKKYSSSLFSKADEMIPKGLSINSSNLDKSLDVLEKTLKMGGERPSTGEALSKIAEIKGKSKNGKIDLKELLAFRPSINEIIDKYKGFDIAMKPAIKEKIIHNLNKVKREVINAGEEYGKNFNPEYLNASRSANEAYAAYSQSNKIKNFIEKKAGSKIQSHLLKGLLGLGGSGVIGGTSALLGLGLGSTIGAGTGIGYKALKTILRSKSPTLRKHYFNILQGASIGNAPEVINNIRSLDKAFIEMEKTGESELI